MATSLELTHESDEKRAARQHRWLLLDGCRLALGLALGAWATRAGISREFLEQVDDFESVPSPETLAKLQQSLGLSDDEVLILAPLGTQVKAAEFAQAQFRFIALRAILEGNLREAKPAFQRAVARAARSLAEALDIIAETIESVLTVAQIEAPAAKDLISWKADMLMLCSDILFLESNRPDDITKEQARLIESIFGLSPHRHKITSLVQMLGVLLSMIWKLLPKENLSKDLDQARALVGPDTKAGRALAGMAVHTAVAAAPTDWVFAAVRESAPKWYRTLTGRDTW